MISAMHCRYTHGCNMAAIVNDILNTLHCTVQCTVYTEYTSLSSSHISSRKHNLINAYFSIFSIVHYSVCMPSLAISYRTSRFALKC